MHLLDILVQSPHLSKQTVESYLQKYEKNVFPLHKTN